MSAPVDTQPTGAAGQTEPTVANFLEELRHQRRASAHTISAYERDLTRLVAFADGTALSALTAVQLRRYVMRLHGAGLAARSLARVLSAWRAYYRWLARRGMIAQNPCDGLRPPKQAKPLPKALPIHQSQALLNVQTEECLEVRDHAMAELLYSSGLRLAELVSLDTPGGLDLQEGTVTVTGKRSKTRLVPLGSKAIAALQNWLALRGEIAPADQPALFVSQRGGRLSARSVERRLAQWAMRQGIGVHVHPHMLRHSFASDVLQSSGDLRAVQEMLGHANISSTQIYTHLDFQHLAKVYDAAHPRARKK